MTSISILSLNLLATSSTTRLKFFGRDDPGLLSIDDISVSTPEPSTLLMISAALLIPRRTSPAHRYDFCVG
jgi:hypothetical protein